MRWRTARPPDKLRKISETVRVGGGSMSRPKSPYFLQVPVFCVVVGDQQPMSAEREASDSAAVPGEDRWQLPSVLHHPPFQPQCHAVRLYSNTTCRSSCRQPGAGRRAFAHKHTVRVHACTARPPYARLGPRRAHGPKKMRRPAAARSKKGRPKPAIHPPRVVCSGPLRAQRLGRLTKTSHRACP